MMGFMQVFWRVYVGFTGFVCVFFRSSTCKCFVRITTWFGGLSITVHRRRYCGADDFARFWSLERRHLRS